MTLTWDNAWLQEYESYWCTIEKIKYLNNITRSELTKVVKYKKSNLPSHLQHFLLEQKSILEQLDLKMEDKHVKWLIDLLGTLVEGDEAIKYFYPYLKYCPLCIEQGYHSFIHQLNFIECCPIHDIPLKTSCPNCNKPIVVELEYSGKLRAFTCNCKHKLISDKPVREIIKNWNMKEDQNVHISSINKLSKATWRLYFYIDYYQKHSILDSYLLVLDNYIFNNKLTERCFTTIAVSKELKSTEPMFENDFLNYLSQVYVSSYKAIAKHIRRRCPEIAQYVKQIKRNKLTLMHKADITLANDIKCDAACYAYIMWRKDIEGIEDIDNIHSKEYPISRILKSIRKNKLFIYFCNEFYLYLKTIHSFSKTQFLVVFEHVIMQMLYKYYQNWLRYAKETENIQGNIPQDLFCQIPYKLPMFLVKFSMDSDLKIYEFNID